MLFRSIEKKKIKYLNFLKTCKGKMMIHIDVNCVQYPEVHIEKILKKDLSISYSKLMID